MSEVISAANCRLVIVSNRLPIVIHEDDDGSLKLREGSGGLVTALAPVLKNRGGVWIGWAGLDESQSQAVQTLLTKHRQEFGYRLCPVFLSEEEVELYYDGFANEIIWPLFHDLPSDCHFDPRYWYAVQSVNTKFAKVTHHEFREGDFLWIHDYHLMLVGRELRKLGVTNTIGFFLHIPFPSLDIFVKLPWRFELLRALLAYDLVGFQTLRDQRNFIQCVKMLLPDMQRTSQRQACLIEANDRTVHVGAFPISIDYPAFSKMAAGKEVADQAWLNREHLKNQKIVFSCDRLDISKGITYRLEAIRHLLKNHPELHEKITFFQVVIPSRTEIPKYKNLKSEIDRLVGEINSQYTKTGWVPIHYLYHPITRKELIALYQISAVALITPIKDGMNLVAKEYIASNVNENGVLILSEFAGAATQLQHEAFLINPYDIEGLATTIFKALTLSPDECRKRMKEMRRIVRHRDVFWWVKVVLNAAISKELNDFPVIEEFTPSETEQT
jgi:trehalose 6-phosphate synthase/phosphatase